MKFSFFKSCPALFLVFFFASCATKIPEVFKEQQKLHYSRSWKQLNNYPMKFGRTDDLYFFNPNKGFVINSEGKLFLTEDGGETWKLKFEKEEKSFFRCLTFKDSLNGWLGTLGPGDKSLRSDDSTIMYKTQDGGETWEPVEFEGSYPGGLCGLQAVSENVIVGCGRVRGPSFFIKSEDGGASWKSYDLNHLAGSLIAPYFYNEQHGILIGGTTTDKIQCRSLILETFDGGTTWDTIFLSEQKGEYCWKVSFPTDKRGFISIQRNAKDGYSYCLQTEDGGKTWFENIYSDEYYYVQGVGFLNENVGWLGGSSNFTMETRDGGKTWLKAADIGRGFNKFQFFGDSLGYGTGFGVFKLEKFQPLPSDQQIDYYESGKIKSRVYYVKGKKNGKASYFYENGNLKSRGRCKNNLRFGSWQFFDLGAEGKIRKVKFKSGIAQISKKSLERYVGAYRVGKNIFRIISFEKGSLYSQISNSDQKFEIFPISETEFIYDGVKAEVEFLLNPEGEVTGHLMKQQGREKIAEKI